MSTMSLLIFTLVLLSAVAVNSTTPQSRTTGVTTGATSTPQMTTRAAGRRKRSVTFTKIVATNEPELEKSVGKMIINLMKKNQAELGSAPSTLSSGEVLRLEAAHGTMKLYFDTPLKMHFKKFDRESSLERNELETNTRVHPFEQQPHRNLVHHVVLRLPFANYHNNGADNNVRKANQNNNVNFYKHTLVKPVIRSEFRKPSYYNGYEVGSDRSINVKPVVFGIGPKINFNAENRKNEEKRIHFAAKPHDNKHRDEFGHSINFFHSVPSNEAHKEINSDMNGFRKDI